MGAGSDLWNRFNTMYNKQDFDGLDSLFASDAVYVDPAGRHEGGDAIRTWLDELAPAFSDVRFETSRLIEQGNTVVAEWTNRCTHSGPLAMPDGSVIPATGNALDSPGVTILDIRDGKIVFARDYFDLLVGMSLVGMSQLGLLPSA
jgi:steroid delta-isomerase-like uncharacterized protein